MNTATQLINDIEQTQFTEEELNKLIPILSKKLSPKYALWFFELSIAKGFLESEDKISQLRNEITTMPIKIIDESDLYTSIPYFRETIFVNGQACHPYAKKQWDIWCTKIDKIEIKDSFKKIRPDIVDLLNKKGKRE